VGLATIPGIRLDRDIKTGFLVLFYLGADLLALLLARTRLRGAHQMGDALRR
jgi:hypothetical protein